MDIYNLDALTLDGEKTKVTVASGPVIIRDGKVLLHKAPDTGKYQFIGGRVDDGMSIRENAVFKALEDLGIKIKLVDDIDPLIVIGKIQRDGKEDNLFLVHYLAKIVEEPEERKYDWFTLDQIKKMTEEGMVPSANVLIASEHFLKVTS